MKLGVFINCDNGFGDQPEVANGASDLMVEVFGDKGKHSRSAVGTNALPRNVSVEIDALVDIS
jgi:enamine deaminase RidA (YjgF/YER057c/UK114 family)